MANLNELFPTDKKPAQKTLYKPSKGRRRTWDLEESEDKDSLEARESNLKDELKIKESENKEFLKTEEKQKKETLKTEKIQKKDQLKTGKRDKKDSLKTKQRQYHSVESFLRNPEWIEYQIMGGMKKELLKYIMEQDQRYFIINVLCEIFGKSQENINSVLRRLQKDGFIKIRSHYKYKEIEVNPSFNDVKS